VISKSGTKQTIAGKYDLATNYKQNMERMFGSTGIKISNYNVFHKDIKIDPKTDFVQE
jgi:hypothetical protein